MHDSRIIKNMALTLCLLFPATALAAPAEEAAPPEEVIIEGFTRGTFCGSGANEFREWSCVKVGDREYSMSGLPPDPAEAESVKTMKEGTPILVHFKVVMEYAEEAEQEVPVVLPLSIRPQS